MKRKLFCEISTLTYKMSVYKSILFRKIYNLLGFEIFAKTKSDSLLPIMIYHHNSLIRRQLENVNMSLQENKAINLKLSTPHITNVLIKLGETFSFWKLVGNLSKRKGYKEGLTIRKGVVSQGIGGGICQFTNLIHWMVLHTELDIIEHHHHDGVDLFPDFNRQIPFGTGTSIMYNYLDYRFKNNTDRIYQLVVYTTDKYLCGEIRSSQKQPFKYHIKSEHEKFINEDGIIYRVGEVYRESIDVVSGNIVSKELIRQNHAKVMYDTSNLTIN